jgi:hypothetical protein
MNYCYAFIKVSFSYLNILIIASLKFLSSNSNRCVLPKTQFLLTVLSLNGSHFIFMSYKFFETGNFR